MNQPPQKVSSLSRRDVLVGLGSLGLLVAGISAGRGVTRFLRPPVSQARATVVVAGPPGDFAAGVLTPLTGGPAFIGRDAGGLFALSAVCPHLGCTVNHAGQELACPCHGSRFTLAGERLDGPTPRALAYLALALNEDGLLEVNLTQPVEAGRRLQE